jgi:hypothetical protein
MPTLASRDGEAGGGDRLIRWHLWHWKKDTSALLASMMPSMSEFAAGSALIMPFMDEEGPSVVGDLTFSAEAGTFSTDGPWNSASSVEMPFIED